MLIISFRFPLHIFAFFLGVLLLTHHPHWLFWSDFLLILYWCHVPLFLWFCCMCGRCSRYLGLNSFECLCVLSVSPVVTSSVCLRLVLFLVFVVFLPVCRMWSVFVDESVHVQCLHYVLCVCRDCLVYLWVCVREALFVCITLTCACVYRGSITGFGQSWGDSCADGLQWERHGLPPQCLPRSAPPHPVRCE